MSTPLVYPEQGVLTLISRAWNLLRVNLPSSLTLMAFPTVLLTLVSVLMSLPAARPTLTGAGFGNLLVSVGILAAGVGLLFLSFVMWGFAGAALIRIYYSAIVSPEPIPLQEGIAFVRRIWLPLLAIIVAISVIWVIFTIINGIVYFSGIFGSFVLFQAFGFFRHLTNPASMPMLVLAMFLFLIWGFLVLAILGALLILQTFLCLFPFIAISTGNGHGVWQNLLYGWRLMLGNMGRVLPFGFTFFILFLILSMVLQLPVTAWMALEQVRLGTGQGNPFVLPFHVNLIYNLWSSVVNMFLVPFSLGAWTLFWYDCQVRKEGLDLKLMFQNILRQRGLEPARYFGGQVQGRA